MIHPFELQELNLNEAAPIVKIKPGTLQKQIRAGLWPGAFYKAGDEWRTTLMLLAECQKRRALMDSGSDS
jgi:hypothetical protein